MENYKFPLAFVCFLVLFTGVLGSITLYFGFQIFNDVESLVKNGVVTKAVVIDVGKKYVETAKYDGYVYVPILQYFDSENNKRTFIYNKSGSVELRHPIGEEIEIIYQKNKTHRERENSFQGLYFIPTGVISMAFLFLGIAIWGIVSIFRNIKMRWK